MNLNCRLALALLVSSLTATNTGPLFAQADCSYADSVCNMRASVFVISTDYFPFGSAVRIGPSTLVTNRHLVVDLETIEITLADGRNITGNVIPTSYPGDLVLVEADLGDGPVAEIDADNDQGPYQTIGAELATDQVRVYPPGERLAHGPGPGVRLHHQAFSQPGNSGGALVDHEGELVAIVASGGQGMNEAIPVAELARLQSMSGPEYGDQSHNIGRAYRGCDQMVDEVKALRGALPLEILTDLEQACIATGNRQMIDFAAIEAGRHGAYELSVELFKVALEMDPDAVKTKLSYLVTLHLLSRYQEEVPIIRSLLPLIPEDPQLQRFAIQAGKWGGDPELAILGVELVRVHNPQMAEAAQRFLDADIPAPPPR